MTGYHSYKDYIESLVGIKYERGGLSCDGLDCFGLVAKMYKDILCVDITRLNLVDSHYALDRALDYFKKVESPKFMDVILMNKKDKHIGVVIDSELMIHASSVSGVCIERYNSFLFKEKINGFYRFSSK